ncbi:MAG: DUF433 domain-containing protein, partial [Chloroflexota bacterium]
LARRADGRTHIAGRRLTPYDMLCQCELGDSPETLSEEYDLSLGEVYEALATRTPPLWATQPIPGH